MPSHRGGRHELGQNFLTDLSTITTIVALTSRTQGPIVEIGAGSGNLTLPLQALHRPITAVEIDTTCVEKLRPRVDATTTVVEGDFLRYRLPRTPHTVVGNVPFHQTTAILRRLLRCEHWTTAILLVQWEVARRRAGVGGATLMTAQWWPWYDFTLIRRVPASAFSPRPNVDGGLITIHKRTTPLIDRDLHAAYSGFVHAVFTGKGRNLYEILSRTAGPHSRAAMKRWVNSQVFPGTPLPRDLTAQQWAQAFTLIQQHRSRSYGHRRDKT